MLMEFHEQETCKNQPRQTLRLGDHTSKHYISSAAMTEESFLSKPGFSFTHLRQTSSVITGAMAISQKPFQTFY
jgi:hypothetical protein